MTNVKDFIIDRSSFVMNNGAGAMNVNQFNPNIRIRNQSISYCNIDIPQGTGNTVPVINYMSLSAEAGHLNINNNFLTNNSSDYQQPAIFTTGVTGGNIKSNTITNFRTGINSIASQIDFYGNVITSCTDNAAGVSGNTTSEINMSPDFLYYTGGNNTISFTGNTSKCIDVAGSYFYTDNGRNTFNTKDENGAYHYYGYMYGDEYALKNETNNCYQFNGTATALPRADVKWFLNGSDVNFYYEPRTCEPIPPGGTFAVFTTIGMLNDTIRLRQQGTGGGFKGSGLTETETDKPPETTEQQTNYKQLLDSININTRKHLYQITESQCYRLLNNFIDSTGSIETLNKLYYVTLSQDSAGNKTQPLKNYYELLIAQNPQKPELISRAFYLIQKCKASLRQYQSAMEGFQLIINQNPYSYEGLVASWDYAATHLLDSLYGSAGGYSSKNRNTYNVEKGHALSHNPYAWQTSKQIKLYETGQALSLLHIIFYDHDSLKFSDTDRKKIVQNINDAIETKRITQTEKIIELQTKSDKGDNRAKEELKTMKTLSETNKIKNPKSINELNQIIQTDIKKIYKSKTDNSRNDNQIIPIQFELYQNYPNPFNPTTKIAFDLPKDTKVKLIIYDILGREIKTLINNEFIKAGKYIENFNASSLASGIYFYRIQAGENIVTKKMVYVK